MTTKYEQELAEWKTKHGMDKDVEYSQDELAMLAEEQASRGKAWCFGCDRRILVRNMRLITRRIDPYMQCDEGEGDYIAKRNRVRLCSLCFAEMYGQNTEVRRGEP